MKNKKPNLLVNSVPKFKIYSKHKDSKLSFVIKNNIFLKPKHSQITLFIILSIAIVTALLIFFFIRDGLIFKEVNPEVKPLYNFVEKCIEQTTEDAIYHIGKTGGYFIKPELSTENNIAYYFYNKENHMPSKEKIEKELSSYVNSMLFFCTKNFIEFPDFEVKQKEIKTNVKIENEKVVFDIDYPLSIKKNKKTYSLKNFNVETNVRLGIIYNIISEIMKEQMKEKEYICLNCIGFLGEKNDVFIDMRNYDEENVIFYVIDKNSEINDFYYIFNFANRYELE